MKKTMVSLLVVLAASQLLAQAFRTHTDRKLGFAIQHPANWRKSVSNPDGSNLTLATQDNLVIIQVFFAQMPNGLTADTFLQQVEQQIGESHVNQLPAEKRHATPEQLKRINAEEASAGYYDLSHDGLQIHQLIMVMRKQSRFYTLTLTIADFAAEQTKELAFKVADSFKIL